MKKEEEIEKIKSVIEIMGVLENIGKAYFSNEFRKLLCKELIAVSNKYLKLIEGEFSDEKEKQYWEIQQGILYLKSHSKLFDN